MNGFMDRVVSGRIFKEFVAFIRGEDLLFGSPHFRQRMGDEEHGNIAGTVAAKQPEITGRIGPCDGLPARTRRILRRRGAFCAIDAGGVHVVRAGNPGPYISGSRAQTARHDDARDRGTGRTAPVADRANLIDRLRDDGYVIR